MSMLDIKTFTVTPIKKLKKLNLEDAIELLTYKRDRKIVIKKKRSNTYNVAEDGFEIREFFDVEENKLVKLLKDLQKIEFPRSHKYFMEIINDTKK